MPIDPSIALNVKPIELPNQLGQFAQAAQIQHYQQQNALAERAMAQEEALNKAYASSVGANGQIDENMLRQNVIGANLGSKLPAVEKTILDTRKLRTEVGKNEFELKQSKADKAMRDIAGFDTREQILADLQRNLDAGNIEPTKAQQIAASVPTDPAKIPAFQVKLLRGILGAKEQLEQQFTSQDYGGGTRVISTPKYGGGPAQVVQGSQVNKTMTPGESASLTKPVWNEAGQGWVTPPTAKNPAGGFTPVPEVQATKDQRSAVKALKTAGYDPVTGEDTISKLIAKSTSGGLEALSSAALGHVFGTSTEGRRAIASLEGTANQIATDIAGGKLGAGVSNTDREFIVAALGDVANPMKPAGDRLAGWEAAKARMMRTGMIPAPTAAPAAVATPATPAAANIPSTPKGVDQSIWNAMTPEERSLWK